MIPIDNLLLIASVLLLASILIAKLLDNIGIPTLLLFIGVGIFAGSEGFGGISFDDPSLAQSIGIISLIFILFFGGLETDWKSSKPVYLPAFSLATIGVIITSIVVGIFVHLLLGESLLWGFLVGSIISSTDAAAVFSILRIKNIGLKGDVKALLEWESGSNDLMAVFLTIGAIELLLFPDKNIMDILLMFSLQMSLGLGAGFGLGKLMVFVNNRLKFSYEGIYPVFSLAICTLIYSLTSVIGGSGFLAIYIAGTILVLVNKNSIDEVKKIFS